MDLKQLAWFDWTHWSRVTHICVSKLTIIDSDNGLAPDRLQAITWTNARILLIGHLGTNFNVILIEIHIFSLKKMHFKLSSGRWRPFCLGLSMYWQGLDTRPKYCCAESVSTDFKDKHDSWHSFYNYFQLNLKHDSTQIGIQFCAN